MQSITPSVTALELGGLVDRHRRPIEINGTTCPTCGGNGIDPAHRCPECGGGGLVEMTRTVTIAIPEVT